MSTDTFNNVQKTYTSPNTGKFISGNPGGGRPKGTLSIKSEIKNKLLEIPKNETKTYLDLMIDKILNQAIKGDGQMIKLILNYVEGLPRQSIEFAKEDRVDEIKFSWL